MRIFSPAVLLACAAAGFTLSAASAVNAQTLAQYTFGAPGAQTLAPTTTGANVSLTAINNTGSSLPTGIGTFGTNTPTPTYASQPILLIGPGATTPALAVANNTFWQFTVTPNAGATMTLTSFAFDAARGGGGTPRGYVLRSSVDNFAADLSAADIPTQRPTLTNFSTPLPGPVFSNLASAVTFRVYSYSPAAASSVDYDNVTLSGTTVAVAVPEPGSLALLVLSGAGGMGALLARRRRRA